MELKILITTICAILVIGALIISSTNTLSEEPYINFVKNETLNGNRGDCEFQKRTEDYNLYYKGDCKTLNEILIKEGIINES